VWGGVEAKGFREGKKQWKLRTKLKPIKARSTKTEEELFKEVVEWQDLQMQMDEQTRQGRGFKRQRPTTTPHAMMDMQHGPQKRHYGMYGKQGAYV
jgi:hypothetical protein